MGSNEFSDSMLFNEINGSELLGTALPHFGDYIENNTDFHVEKLFNNVGTRLESVDKKETQITLKSNSPIKSSQDLETKPSRIVPITLEQLTNRDSKRFMDITHLLTIPQKEAAQRLGVPSSTLSKRWREATVKRKWPQKIVSKIDKEIEILVRNIQPNAPMPIEIEKALGALLKRRTEELRPVVIRL